MKLTLSFLSLLNHKIRGNFDAIVKRCVEEAEYDLEKGKLEVYVSLRDRLLEEVERYLDYELDTSTIHFEDK